MKNERTCLRCLAQILHPDIEEIKFCPNCGDDFSKIDAMGEQPFHLPESNNNLDESIREGLIEIEKIFNQSDVQLPEILKDSLDGAHRILRTLAKDIGNRKEVEGLLKEVKNEEEAFDWDKWLKGLPKT